MAWIPVPPVHHLLSFITNRALLFPGHLKLSNENQWKFWEPMEFFESSVTNTDFKKVVFIICYCFLLVCWLKKLFLQKWTIFLPSSPSLARSSTLNYFHATFIVITPVCLSRWKTFSSWEYYQINAPSHNCGWYLWKPHKASWLALNWVCVYVFKKGKTK